MQATLINFGDNTRVVNDSTNTAVSIGIGELKECDIHDVHFHMIRRAIATETLLVVPKDVRKTERLNAIMQLMRELMTESYDDVLTKYNMLGSDTEDGEAPRIRPTRDQMRKQLRDVARQEVAVALRLQSKVNIREQGDEVTRKVVPPAETQTPDVVEPKAPEPHKGPVPRDTTKPKPNVRKAKAAKPAAKSAKKAVASTRKRERL